MTKVAADTNQPETLERKRDSSLDRKKIGNLIRPVAQLNDLNSIVTMVREERQLLRKPGFYVDALAIAMGQSKVLVKIPGNVSMVLSETALMCFLKDGFAVIGAESRNSYDNVVYQEEPQDDNMIYAEDWDKKVHMAGGLVLGISGKRIYCNYLVSVFYYKIQRLQSLCKAMPTARRLTRFLHQEARKLYIAHPDMEIVALIGGHDGGAPHVYKLHRMDTNDVVMEEVTEPVTMLGSGKPYTDAYFSNIDGGHEKIDDAYSASHHLCEAARYASLHTKTCGGPVRNYIITETGVECLKYVHPQEAAPYLDESTKTSG